MSKNDNKPYNTRSNSTSKKGKSKTAADNMKSATDKMKSATDKTKMKSAIKNKPTKENYTIHMSSDEEDDDDYEDVSSEDDITDSEDVSEFIDTDDEEVNKVEVKEFQKLLYQLYPSKFMEDKVKDDDEENVLNKKKHKKTKRRVEEEENEEEEEVKPAKFNISFLVNGAQQLPFFDMDAKESLFDEDDYDDTESEEDDTDDDEDEDDTDEDDTDEDEEEAETDNKKNKKSAITDLDALIKMKTMFEGLTAEEKKTPVMKRLLKDLTERETNINKKKEKKTRKERKANTQRLKKLLREKDVMNDLKYFHKNMSLPEQQTVITQLELIHKNSYVDKPYRLRLLDADIPLTYKASAYRKISSLRHMEPGGGEYFKMKNWVDTFMQIPFGKYKSLPLTLKDGVEKCHEFMDQAKKTLDQAVYGLDDAKLQIMQMIGQWIVNPDAIGTAIAIKGPMGTGKTTLVKDGISKILGRDFAFIALGGATDSSFLEGHSYTYEGSTWGKIVDLLIKCKSMNPVIYFDELDKISDTPKGEEIVGILTHLTDTTQNSQFHDRYFSEIDFDLSRCLFIFSYNDESKVNRILLDRMYRIQTKGYNQAQKTTIANNYLLPKICEQVVFKTEDIVIPEETMHYIITNYTDKEDGVRTLKRCLEIIHTKLNLYRLMKPDTNLFESEMSIKVEFPMQVTPTIVDKLIKKDADNGHWHNMYM